MALEIRDWTDQASWDAFLGSQKTGNINQSWGWGEVISLLGARPIRRAVADGDEIKALMTVASNEIRFLSRRLLYLNRGPVCDEPTEEIFGALAGDLERLSRTEHALGAKIEPYVPAENRTWPVLLRKFSFVPLFPPSQMRSQWMIDLEHPLDELQAAMKSKWRYNIRLADKKGVEISRGSARDLTEYYAIYKQTAARDGFVIYDQQYYGKLFEIFWKLGQFDLLLARLEGRLIAAVTLVTIGRNSWYVHGASSNEHREVMAPHALQWEAMKLAKERGALVYDMRGISDSASSELDMSGVYRFKQGFGGRQVMLMEQYAKPYQRPWFDLWKAYWQGRYMYVSLQRRRKKLPHRTWA